MGSPTDELRLDEPSRWPERFSRRLDASTKPDSLREMGVTGKGGYCGEVGDI